MKSLLYSSLFLLFSCVVYAQVGVGTTTPASTLDVTAAFPTGTLNPAVVDGVLIPRVTRERARSMTAVPTSTMIYITEVDTGSATGTTANVNTIGFYFFNGSTWETLSTSGATNWTITGNSGLSGTTNFLGTTDDIDVAFRRNSLAAGKIGATSTNFGLASANVNTAAGTTAFGVSALAANVAAVGNTAVGYTALAANSAANNTAVGYGAGDALTTADNTAIGFNALGAISGAGSTAVGSGTLALNTAAGSTAVGAFALDANDAATGSTAVGYQALSASNANNNTALGYQAGDVLTTADNTALGYNALGTTSGAGSTAVGSGTLALNTAAGSTAVGAFALDANDAATGSTAVGYQALSASNANNNTALGYQAGDVLTTAENTAIGFNALGGAAGANSTAVGSNAGLASSGVDATLVGYQAGNSNTGAKLTAVGGWAGRNNAGIQNTYLGYNAGALMNQSACNNNVAVGFNALQGNIGRNNSQNTAIGGQALENLSTEANNNTAVGYLTSVTTGSNNTMIGYQATCSIFSNSTAIGNGAVTSASNTMKFGNASITANNFTGCIITTGNVQGAAFAACSDFRYKKDILPISSSLNTLNKLKAVNYYFKTEKELKADGVNTNAFKGDETHEKQIGFIAQDVEILLPEVVHTNSDGYKSIDYSKFSPFIIEAVQEQQALIEQLQNANAELVKINAAILQRLEKLEKK